MDEQTTGCYRNDMKKIKAIIFDLNGVFIVGHPKLSERFYRDFGIEESVFLLALHDIMSQIRKPDAKNAYSYWQPYLKEWNVPLNEEQFLNYWFTAEKEDIEMISLAKILKQKGLTLFVLSNNFRERAEYYKKQFPFLSTFFEKIYYSWQTGFIKPDKRAYELLLRENNLQPSECMYFDDSEKNVACAQEIGIESYFFRSAADVQEKIPR